MNSLCLRTISSLRVSVSLGVVVIEGSFAAAEAPRCEMNVQRERRISREVYGTWRHGGKDAQDCVGCQECQSKSKTGHSSSAPACALHAFLVTVHQLNLSILVSVLLLGFLTPNRFHRRMVEALV